MRVTISIKLFKVDNKKIAFLRLNGNSPKCGP